MEQRDPPVFAGTNVPRSGKCLMRLNDLLVTCFDQQAPDIVRGSTVGIDDIPHAGLSRLVNNSK